MAKSDSQSADASSKRFSNFRSGKKGFKAPIEGLQYVVFNYTSSSNNKNVFVGSTKKLSHHITVLRSIRHKAPTAVRAVRTLPTPTFDAPVKPDKLTGWGINRNKEDENHVGK